MKKHDLTTAEIPIDPGEDVTRRKVGLFNEFWQLL